MDKAIVVAILAGALAGCACGRGIGIEAMMQDHACEQWGFKHGTPEYADCRLHLAQQSAARNAAMQGYYLRLQQQIWTI
jgi:hypothetical protein